MRFACRINLLLLLLGAAVASAQINPATQIRWPSNCVGGNLFYDIVHNTCTAGTVTVTIGVNGTPITSPNFSDTNPAAPGANQNVHFQTSGSNISAYVAPSSGGGGGGGATCYADQQAGSTWDAKVQACLNTIYAAGGGTVDARSLNGTQTMSNSVVVGNGSPTVLLMGAMSLTLAANAQFLINSNATFSGMGPAGTVIKGGTTVPLVQQAFSSGGVSNAHWEHFGVQGSGPVTSGVAGIQFAGANAGMPYPNSPDTTARNMNIGSWYPGEAAPWPGYIAQFAVYNYALTAAQVNAHYTTGTTGTGYKAAILADNPYAYYPLTETTGTTAVDVANSHHGTYGGGVTLAAVNGVPGDVSCGGVCKMPLFNNGTVLLPSLPWLTNTNWSVEGWYQPNVPDGGWKRLWTVWNTNDNFLIVTENSTNDGLQVDGYGGHVGNAQIGFNQGSLYHVVIVHTATPTPSMVFYVNGVPIRTGSDSFQSFVSDVSSTGFDIGLLIRGEHGCVCYNSISDVTVAGQTAGLYSDNVSGYSYGINSNTFTNGKYGGQTGVDVNGGNLNLFIKPDIENAPVASMHINDAGDTILSPYFEASGKLRLDGYVNTVFAYEMNNNEWTGSCTTCLIFGPNASPDYLGVNQALLFGGNQYPNTSAGAGIYYAGLNGLNAYYTGSSTSTYGRYGHAGLAVGGFTYAGGMGSTGYSSLNTIGPVPAPTAVAVGGTGTTYTYYAIAYDRFGGVTLPSAPVSVSGPATLDGSHYIYITPPQTVDGVWCWDILKGDTSHILTTDGTNHCMNSSSYLGINDTGQGTVAWASPGRDTTADFTVHGALTAGLFGISGCPPGSFVKADYSGCATITPGSPVANTTLTVGTTAIAAGLPCSGPYTVSMANLTPAMTVKISPASDISNVTGWGPVGGGGLYFVQWPTAGTLNYKICNASTASITPTASTTWNVSAQ